MPARLLLLACAVLLASCSHTIDRSWTGSSDPPLGKGELTNGDFVIYGPGTLGDGIKDNTRWTLDLSKTPLVTEPETLWRIESAELSLDFQGNGSTHADVFHFNDNALTWPAFGSLKRPGQWRVKAFTLELTDPFSSEDLLAEIRRGNGIVELHHKDDALISRASLRIRYCRPCR